MFNKHFRRKAAQMICGATLAWTATTESAFAAIEAVSVVTPNPVTLTNPPFTLGWTFTVGEAVTLEQLGFYDHGGNGLLDAHAIGLWSAGGSLLRTTTIFDGSDGELVASNFRYKDVDPLLLTAGASYVIGATYASGRDAFQFLGTGAHEAIDQITVTGGAQQNGAGLRFPARPVANAMLVLGPNFRIEGDVVTPVPEPGAWTLMILGFGGAGAALRRRRSLAIA